MLNQVSIIGRLGKDPDARTFEDGGQISSFTVATTERYKNRSGEQVEDTEWHNVVARGKLAEICNKYLSKGGLVFIGGRIKTRSYEKDGVTRYVTEIVARDMKMLSSKGDNEAPKKEEPQWHSTGQSEPMPTHHAKESTNTDDDDDLPF